MNVPVIRYAKEVALYNLLLELGKPAHVLGRFSEKLFN